MAIDLTRCRTFGHAWDVIPSTRRPPWGSLITLRCVGCGTIREDVVNSRTGTLINRNYIYPLGYKDAPKMTRREWRTHYIRGEKAQGRIAS